VAQCGSSPARLSGCGEDPIGSSRLQHVAAAIGECLLTPTHSLHTWPESGHAAEVVGERSEVAWVVWCVDGDPVVHWHEPGLALLRNDTAGQPERP